LELSLCYKSSPLSKTGTKIFFLEFVTFFDCPKKVTKEKTPKSNARDAFPRARIRFQPLCSSAFVFAEIGSHAITTFPHSPRFRSPSRRTRFGRHGRGLQHNCSAHLSNLNSIQCFLAGYQLILDSNDKSYSNITAHNYCINSLRRS